MSLSQNLNRMKSTISYLVKFSHGIRGAKAMFFQILRSGSSIFLMSSFYKGAEINVFD